MISSCAACGEWLDNNLECRRCLEMQLEHVGCYVRDRIARLSAELERTKAQRQYLVEAIDLTVADAMDMGDYYELDQAAMIRLANAERGAK